MSSVALISLNKYPQTSVTKILRIFCNPETTDPDIEATEIIKMFIAVNKTTVNENLKIEEIY
jgi:hypothetical protein